jgi:mono/diheme cytochrome c family protein
MAMGPDLLESEEKRSYGAVFLLAVALLLACTVWALWQDSFSRHLWKKYKTDFYRTAIEKYEAEEAAERARLAEIEEYTTLKKQLEDVRTSLESGDLKKQLDDLNEQLEKAKLHELETDLDLRIVKGEIEEAWYRLEHARHEGESGNEEHDHLEHLMSDKEGAQAAYDAAVGAVADINAEISEVRATEEKLVAQLRPYNKELEAIDLKLDSVSYELFGRRVPHIPVIEQVVLPGFDRNNFERWVDRVERCQNCHVAIDKVGFEDMENPLKTHPDRKYYLGNHEVRKFGCTPCHGGQGASINSVEQAHGKVPFWEDPLLDTADKVESKCLTCHLTGEGVEGVQVAGRGEALVRELGCHGCHLMKGFEDLYKTGPSLLRVGAKVRPEWLVDWIEAPKNFRPRTRMPHFFATREEAEGMAAYLLSSSLGASEAWLSEHPQPQGVSPASAPLVEKGEELTQSLGCLGCHAFVPGEYASEIAHGKDTAPNLARIAEKTDARWMYYWIKNPRGFSDTARMPRLRLNHEEARAITSYLATLTQQEPTPVDAALRQRLADPATIDFGEKTIRKYGCPGCHWIHGFENESRVSVELNSIADKHLEELFFGDRLDIPHTWDDWVINKIMTPRTYQTERITQLMPKFGLDEEDARAITVYLSSKTAHVIHPDYLPDRDGMERDLFKGRAIVGYYNCAGCHSFDGKEGAIRRHYTGLNAENAPPILVGEGKKLQPEWFVDFLKKPMRLRPWLQVRMPTFGLNDKEANGVVDYFAALDGYDLGPVVLESREEAHSPLLATPGLPEDVVDCRACHVDGRGPLPDTTYAVSRTQLTDAEIRSWLSENLGVEVAGSEEPGEDALREYLGAAAD